MSHAAPSASALAAMNAFAEQIIAIRPWTGLADISEEELTAAKVRTAASMGDTQVADLLDTAAAAKEIATLVAMFMAVAEGSTDEALALCDQFADTARPTSLDELDAVAIARQAILESVALRLDMGQN